MIEVQVRQHHHVHVFVLEAGGMQRFEQHVAIFDDPVALAQLRFEERADAGLEQHRLAVERGREQCAARERDAVLRIRRGPARPQGARRVAEHRATIELLRVAEDRPEFHGTDSNAPRC